MQRGRPSQGDQFLCACNSLCAVFCHLYGDRGPFRDRVHFAAEEHFFTEAWQANIRRQPQYKAFEQQLQKRPLLNVANDIVERLAKLMQEEAYRIKFHQLFFLTLVLPAVVIEVITQESELGKSLIRLTVGMLEGPDPKLTMAANHHVLKLFLTCSQMMRVFIDETCEQPVLDHAEDLCAHLGQLMALAQPLRQAMSLTTGLLETSHPGLLSGTLELLSAVTVYQQRWPAAATSHDDGGVKQQRARSAEYEAALSTLRREVRKLYDAALGVCRRTLPPDCIEDNRNTLDVLTKGVSGAQGHFALLRNGPPDVPPGTWAMLTVHHLMTLYRQLCDKPPLRFHSNASSSVTPATALLCNASAALATVVTADGGAAEAACGHGAKGMALRLIIKATAEMRNRRTALSFSDHTLPKALGPDACLEMCLLLPCVEDTVRVCIALLDARHGTRLDLTTSASPKLLRAAAAKASAPSLRQGVTACVQQIRAVVRGHAPPADPCEDEMADEVMQLLRCILAVYGTCQPARECSPQQRDASANRSTSVQSIKSLVLSLLQLFGRLLAVVSEPSERRTGPSASIIVFTFLNFMANALLLPMDAADLDLLQQIMTDMLLGLCRRHGGGMHHDVRSTLRSLAATQTPPSPFLPAEHLAPGTAPGSSSSSSNLDGISSGRGGGMSAHRPPGAATASSATCSSPSSPTSSCRPVVHPPIDRPPVALDHLLSRLSISLWRDPDGLISAVVDECDLCDPTPHDAANDSLSRPPPGPTVWVRAKPRGWSGRLPGCPMVHNVTQALLRRLGAHVEACCDPKLCHVLLLVNAQMLLLCVHGLHSLMRLDALAFAHALRGMDRSLGGGAGGALPRGGFKVSIADLLMSVLLMAQVMQQWPADAGRSGIQRDSVQPSHVAARLLQATSAFYQELVMTVPDVGRVCRDGLSHLAAPAERQP